MGVSKRDPLDAMQLGFDMTPEETGRVRKTTPSEVTTGALGNNRYGWRCLACLEGGSSTDEDSVPLAVHVHLADCTGPQDEAYARLELIQTISAVSEHDYAAGWLMGIENLLLRRGGIWKTLAEQYGWPDGWNGLDGWHPDYEAAAEHLGIPIP